MEEDIKILEEFLDLARTRDYKGDLTGSFDEFELEVEEKEYKALENLLTRYKQLEKKNIDIAEKLYTERMANKVMSNNIIGYQEELENSIPKSKVKEKIEELDNKRRKFTSDNVNNFYLQEFTRKYTQKSDHDYGVFSTPEAITYCTNNELLGRVEVLQELLSEE